MHPGMKFVASIIPHPDELDGFLVGLAGREGSIHLRFQVGEIRNGLVNRGKVYRYAMAGNDFRITGMGH